VTEQFQVLQQSFLCELHREVNAVGGYPFPAPVR
jgi:hypothetical protein